MPDSRGSRLNRPTEHELHGSLAGPAAPAEFRDRLRRELLAAHPAASTARFAPDRPESRKADVRSRAQRHERSSRRRWPRVAVTLAAVAAAAVLAIVYWPRVTVPPGPALGALPPAGARLPAALSGAGGPGYTFELSFELAGDLAGTPPPLPTSALAYKLPRWEQTEALAASLAARLGIPGPVVPEGWQDGQILAVDPGDGRPSLRVFPDGYIAFARHDYDYRPRLREELPADAAALAAAAAWLTSAGLVQPDELGPGAIHPDLGIGVLLVRFRPSQPEGIVTLAPWAQVELGLDGVVVSGSTVWFGQGESDTYPLRTVAEAWQDVLAGKASLWWEATEYPGPSDDRGVVRGRVTITSIRLAAALALGDDGEPYLVPVYALAGTAEVDDGGGSVESLPVLAWVGAVAPAHQAP